MREVRTGVRKKILDTRVINLAQSLTDYYILREWYCGHTRLCVYVCLSVRGRMPTLLHGPGCNLGEW